MPARRKLSVAPRSDGGWAVSSGKSTLSTHRRKDTAVAAGRRQAKRQAPSQLVIKGSDGRIKDQRSYELTSGGGASKTRSAASKTRTTRSAARKSQTRRTGPAARRSGRKSTVAKRTTGATSKRSTARRATGRGQDQKVAEIMTPNPRTLPMTASVGQAAETMLLIDAGTVLVADEADRVVGIVTDRDIAIRAVAEGRDPLTTTVGDISTPYPASVSPGTSVRDAVKLMRERDIRRLPVVDGERAVGIVSLGDLAILQDPASVLADISAAPSTDRTASGGTALVETTDVLDTGVPPSVRAVEEVEFGSSSRSRR